ncbi:hypothetical protein Q9966_014279 [Columba livia]|nr:hypothetical protein Q9966_014279 [Columba livia]
MEAWRQCARWLVAARVLPAAHRASGPEGHVWDLAQALRDGVLLCHLLNALLPRAVSPHDICPRPQMSQECSQRANNGRFSLRDLLMVPMQRVLKYHLLLQRRGDNYEAKDVVDLQSHQLRDGGLGPRDGKKWSHTFLLIATAGLQGYELFFKTHELKKKWLEQFEMALSNIFPEHALADGHEFQMFSFEDTTSCRACQMLLRFRGEVKHIKVMTGEGLFRVTDKKAFKGLVELVEFYQRHSLRDCFKALDTTLVVAFKEPERRAGPWAHGAVRSFGSAKARYDFSARDRTELTLREGDVIRVLSKKGHPGWWKGEIYGRVGPPRVGWFPANYVDEDYSDYC